jgi:hypothetical protein
MFFVDNREIFREPRKPTNHENKSSCPDPTVGCCVGEKLVGGETCGNISFALPDGRVVNLRAEPLHSHGGI